MQQFSVKVKMDPKVRSNADFLHFLRLGLLNRKYLVQNSSKLLSYVKAFYYYIIRNMGILNNVKIKARVRPQKVSIINPRPDGGGGGGHRAPLWFFADN